MRYDEPLLVFQVLCFVVLVSTVDFFSLKKLRTTNCSDYSFSGFKLPVKLLRVQLIYIYIIPMNSCQLNAIDFLFFSFFYHLWYNNSYVLYKCVWYILYNNFPLLFIFENNANRTLWISLLKACRVRSTVINELVVLT